MTATVGARAGDGRRTVAVLVAFVLGLATFDVLRHALVPDRLQTAVNVLAIAAVAVVTLAARMTAEELGTARADLPSGLRWGGAAFTLIATILLVAAAVPATRGLFEGDDVDVDVGGAGAMLWRVLVVIPIGTVVLEELAFRGVLLGLLRRLLDDRWAVVVSAVLFGLWHLPSIAGDGIPTVFGTVAATTVAGVMFAWLRLRSGSLLAPALAHVATNSVTFALAWALAT